MNLPSSRLDDRLKEAIKAANLQTLVDEVGLEFQVGDRGSALSGGQKQRVCIARVFMKRALIPPSPPTSSLEPKILLLDEVTSALDAIAESEVMAALERLMVGRTTFIIAHRLHTIAVPLLFLPLSSSFSLQNVDRVVVLKDGLIVDEGLHADLISRPGFFKTMWDTRGAAHLNTPPSLTP